jgi:hypothetical protein
MWCPWGYRLQVVQFNTDLHEINNLFVADFDDARSRMFQADYTQNGPITVAAQSKA